MRIAVVAAAVCICMVGLSLADSASASIHEPTHIAAQGLGPALKQLAQSRGLQVLYLSKTVRDVRTNGANGDITANEALEQLLTGTGLTYRYLDQNTVTVIPISTSSLSDADKILLAQAPPTPAAPPVSAAPEPAPLTEIIVTGSRISSPNEVSTSPIQVVSSQSIRVSGKTDISDIITQLPQNYNNDLGQDLGNGTSGLTTAGGVATADLRGLGPARTLVLIDGRRLGVGSPNTAIAQPAPDLDQIPAGLVERVEVVTGGASAAYGSDAIAGVVNFIMKKNFEGFQVDGQFGENWHGNHDTIVQNLVQQFGYTPPTGTAKDGRNRSFDMLMGTNFADGKGNVTAFLSYRHADPVASSQRDFGACQLFPTTDANGNLNGLTCGGSTNSNWFQPTAGPNAGTVYSVSGTSFVPRGSVPTTPPASYNSQPFIYMTREVFRIVLHGRQDPPAGGAGRAVQGQQSARSDGRGRLLRQLQQSLVERAAAGNPLHAGASCSGHGKSRVIDRPGEDRPPQRRGRQSLHRFPAYELPRGLGRQGNLRRCLEL